MSSTESRFEELLATLLWDELDFFIVVVCSFVELEALPRLAKDEGYSLQNSYGKVIKFHVYCQGDYW